MYAEYIRQLGWQVETIEKTYVYIKPLPLIGGLAKIQRCKQLPHIRSVLPLVKKYRLRTLAVEPDCSVSQSQLNMWARRTRIHVRLTSDHFLPTKTIRVDLTPDVETIFHRFSEAKRRGVRRAKKYGVSTIATQDIQSFIQLKNISAGFLGFITTHGLHKLYMQAAPKHTDVLLAKNTNHKTVAGIFLLYWQRTAYYWVAGATQEGKHLFAPTLLVWEAIQKAKKQGCRVLDFVGVWDERQPDKNHEWKGFTKFKEGFGGYTMYYPLITT